MDQKSPIKILGLHNIDLSFFTPQEMALLDIILFQFEKFGYIFGYWMRFRTLRCGEVMKSVATAGFHPPNEPVTGKTSA